MKHSQNKTYSVDARFLSDAHGRHFACSGNGAGEFHKFDRHQYGYHHQEVQEESQEGRCRCRGQVICRRHDSRMPRLRQPQPRRKARNRRPTAADSAATPAASDTTTATTTTTTKKSKKSKAAADATPASAAAPPQLRQLRRPRPAPAPCRRPPLRRQLRLPPVPWPRPRRRLPRQRPLRLPLRRSPPHNPPAKSGLTRRAASTTRAAAGMARPSKGNS